MISTLKQAEEKGLDVQREVRFYAVDKGGYRYFLTHDWTLEVIDRELIKKALLPLQGSAGE